MWLVHWLANGVIAAALWFEMSVIVVAVQTPVTLDNCPMRTE